MIFTTFRTMETITSWLTWFVWNKYDHIWKGSQIHFGFKTFLIAYFLSKWYAASMVCLIVIVVSVWCGSCFKTVPPLLPSVVWLAKMYSSIFAHFTHFLLYLVSTLLTFFSLDTFSIITIHFLSLVFKQYITYVFKWKIRLNWLCQAIVTILTC